MWSLHSSHMPLASKFVLFSLAFACLCAALSASPAPAPRLPRVAGDFSANATVAVSGAFNDVSRTSLRPSLFLFSRSNQALQYRIAAERLHAASLITITGNTDGFATDLNGNCYYNIPGMGSKFTDWFAWLAVAKYGGQVPCDSPSKECALWFYERSAPHFIHLSLIADGDRPYQFATVATEGTRNVSAQFNFTTFVPSSTPVSIEYPPSCERPEAPCQPSTPPVATVEMLQLHGFNNSELGNSNTGDYIGDLAFICADLISPHPISDGADLVSLYLVGV